MSHNSLHSIWRVFVNWAWSGFTSWVLNTVINNLYACVYLSVKIAFSIKLISQQGLLKSYLTSSLPQYHLDMRPNESVWEAEVQREALVQQLVETLPSGSPFRSPPQNQNPSGWKKPDQSNIKWSHKYTSVNQWILVNNQVVLWRFGLRFGLV